MLPENTLLGEVALVAEIPARPGLADRVPVGPSAPLPASPKHWCDDQSHIAKTSSAGMHRGYACQGRQTVVDEEPDMMQKLC